MRKAVWFIENQAAFSRFGIQFWRKSKKHPGKLLPGGFGAQCRYDRCPYRKKKGGHKSRRDRWEK